MGKKAQREQGLARTRAANHEGRAAARQSSARDLIKSLNAGRGFCRSRSRRFIRFNHLD
jgi:hypothetical protein